MKILFLHGKGSDPTKSRKVEFLRAEGNEVIAPQLDDNDFDESVKIASCTAAVNDLDLIIGSSRGGAVAMRMVQHVHGNTPMVLICPAWRNYMDAPPDITNNLAILHSPNDEVVPLIDSHEIPCCSIRKAGKDHSMNDDEARYEMLRAMLDAMHGSPGTGASHICAEDAEHAGLVREFNILSEENKKLQEERKAWIRRCECCDQEYNLDLRSIGEDSVRCGSCCVGCVKPLGSKEWVRGESCPANREG